MSKQDLSRKLEVGDLIVGECRCDPTKKVVVEVVESAYRKKLKIPVGYRYWADTPSYFLSDNKNRAWGDTVGSAIGFLTGGGQYTEQLHQDYHNWKHIPKSDFTFEIGDVLYGECACTPSKFVVFEVCDKERIKVVDCWNKVGVGETQCVMSSRIYKKGVTLNEHLKYVLINKYKQYNYIKYSKEEWQKRQRSKFIIPGALIEKQEPTTHTFKKSDFKVTETDKEIRVAPKCRNKVDVVVLHRAIDTTGRFGGDYVVVKFNIESEKIIDAIRVEGGAIRHWPTKKSYINSVYRKGDSGRDYLWLTFHQTEGALKTHQETDPILLPLTFYQDNIEDIKTALREYLEQ